MGNTVLIGKTAFISDPKYNKFFRENDVDVIMFESAAKINTMTPALTGWGNTSELANIKLQGSQLKLIKKIGLNEISLGAIVNSDKRAALPQQAFKDLSIEESKVA